MKIQQTEIEPARIEMIPLIDSIFLILVYFIYAFLSMSVHRGMPLELPKAAASAEIKTEDYAVSITKDAQVYFNKQSVSMPQLKDILTQIQGRQGDVAQTVYIYADQDTHHGAVVSVLDLLRQIQWTKVYIETGTEKV